MAHFFTADTHFGHVGVLTMSRRPFGAGEIGLHDRMLVEAWNARVTQDDHVWHLGDFAYGPKRSRIHALFEQLAGHKHLIRGNHDYTETTGLPWFEPPRDLVETSLEGTRVVLAHYPMRAWRGAYKGALHLFGHMHGRYTPTAQSLDVGVDCWSYAPVTLPEIQARLAAYSDVPPEEHAAGRAAED